MEQSRYAVVTGASSGIGECFARALAARHRNVVLIARSAEKLHALAAELRAYGIDAVPMPCDLSVRGSAESIAAALAQRALEADLLVNNAGFGARGVFWELPLDRQMAMLRLNVEALMELTYRVVKPMVARHSGAIINVSSTASFQPVPWTTVYGATKAFVTSFSLALAEELREHGVRVVTLCPGGTRTNFLEASQYGHRTIPGGMQEPSEVAEDALNTLDNGGGLVVPRFVNKFTVFVQRFVPRGIVTRAAGRLFRPRSSGTGKLA
jgi:uncharacterized protein